MDWLGTIDRQTVSDLAGTLSFVVWLFAQSPQLYENYRRGSVDGLSPVFLTQWMLGDVTNLVGCVLTQQLPFQIAVATYFCCIDCCIMIQFTYYWTKARRERKRKKRAHQRTNSLTAYANNPYSVLSETSELLPGRASRQHSLLRSSSRRRNLTHSQLLPHRHAQAAHEPHPDKLAAAAAETAQHPRPHASRSRSRQVMSRSGSTDAVPGVGSVANYRALSNAAMSVAQLAQEAARRREAMLHRLHTEGDDYFAYSRPGSPRSHRSKSRASESPIASLPPSRSRSRVNSNELGPESARVDLTASAPSLTTPTASAADAGRRSRVARSMSARRKPVAGPVDFVPSALSPTREGRDAERSDDETESEDISGAESMRESAESGVLAESVDSLATVSTEASGESGPVEPRGRDMVRTASRLETVLSSGAATPAQEAGRSGEASPFSAGSSSEGTARHASPKPHRMAESHHDLGRQDDESSDDQVGRGGGRRKLAKPRRERDVGEAMEGSVELTGMVRSKMVRSESARSHALASTSSVGRKRSGAKSPASMRRTIGMVLLGLMMVSTLPSSSNAAAIGSLAGGLEAGVASWNRLVGRISAWLCALLYITSRIPQIWENHIRRSVAGLSILLFIAAFSGNLLYTISVLSNPTASSPNARAYLQESLPFLLGSGGTLIFDLIIVGQWLAWRHNPPLLA